MGTVGPRLGEPHGRAEMAQRANRCVAVDRPAIDVGLRELLFGKFELVEISVVDLVPTHRVIERARDVDPDRAVLLAKVVR